MNHFDVAIGEQLARLDARLAAGMPRAGWKVCVNDLRMQKKLGLAASFVGFLDGECHLASGGTWLAEDGAVLGVEPELAILFRTAVSPADDAGAIRRAIAGVAPAIEVVDWREAKFDLSFLAASSSFHAGFVTGELRPLSDVPAIAESCPWFRRGKSGTDPDSFGNRDPSPISFDDLLGVGDPSLVPADLTVLVAEVARFLATYGRSIEADDWLLCGACTNPGRVEVGDSVEADFGTLGKVGVRFA